MVAPVGVRLNPNFTMFAGTGAPSKFGIDEEQFLEAGEFLASLRHLRIVGLHIHVATQIWTLRCCVHTTAGCWS